MLCVQHVFLRALKASPANPFESRNPTLLLVEDEEVLRGLLREHIAFNHPRIRILETGDGASGWAIFRKEQPEYCVIDLRLPTMDGWSLIELMAGHHTPPRILILTAQTNWVPPGPFRCSERVLFLDKTAPLEKLSSALRELITKDTGQESAFSLSGVGTNRTEDIGLTKRERLIVSLIGGGMPIRSIAEMLGISLHTALTHRKNILRKLDLNSSNQLVRYAIETGISGARRSNS